MGTEVLNKCVGEWVNAGLGMPDLYIVSRETRNFMSNRDFYMKSLDKFVN